jgi:predicted DNA-binding protein
MFQSVADPERPKLIPVRLGLSSEQHARLRVLAARHGLPMSQYVRRLVEKNLEKSGD